MSKFALFLLIIFPFSLHGMNNINQEDIAIIYNKLVKNKLSDSNRIEYTKFGVMLKLRENNHFFRIDVNYLENNGHKEIKKIYETLEKYGFIIKLANIRPLMISTQFYELGESTQKKSFMNIIENMKKKMLGLNLTQDIEDTTTITFLKNNDEFSDMFFNKAMGESLLEEGISKGFLFRDKTNLDSIENLFPAMRELFEENEEIKLILEKVIITLFKILNKLENLDIAFDSCNSYEDMISIIKGNIDFFSLEKLLEKQNPQTRNITDILAVKIILKSNIITLRNRLEGISNIPAAEIELLLLYFSYLIDEQNLRAINSNEILGFTNILAGDEDFNLTNILSSKAQEIMEKINFFNKKVKVNTPKKQQLNIGKNKNKRKRPTKRNNKNNKSPKKPTISIVNNEKKESLVGTFKKVSIDSKSKVGSNTYGFKIEKKHRILDTMARLLAAKLGNTVRKPGCVSLAIINDSNVNKIAISTNNFIPREKIIEAFEMIFEESINIANKSNDIMEDIRIKKIEIKKLEKQINDLIEIKTFFNKKKELDYLKFYQSISQSYKKYQENIAEIFNNGIIDGSRIIVLDNPFFIHSELIMIKYLNNNQYSFKDIKIEESEYPYQYIGNSLKCCPKCNALINGNKDIIGFNQSSIKNLSIFMRGSHEANYPGFFIPKWALDINKKKVIELRSILNSLGIDINDFNENNYNIISKSPYIDESESSEETRI